MSRKTIVDPQKFLADLAGVIGLSGHEMYSLQINAYFNSAPEVVVWKYVDTGDAAGLTRVLHQYELRAIEVDESEPEV